MYRSNNVAQIIAYIAVFSVIILLAHSINQSVSVINKYGTVETSQCIIIDAGHGGVDGGATSVSGVLESGINLDIALRLEDLLHLLGKRTLLIRKSDISLHTNEGSIAAKKVSDLKQRVEIVNSTPEAILVSIHQNAFPDGRYSGAQVFYATQPQSRVLAKDIQDSFIRTLNPGSNRRVKEAKGIYLMENINCIGVLIECGFISNPTEDYLLRSPEYQKKVCCVIAASLSTFKLSDSIS